MVRGLKGRGYWEHGQDVRATWDGVQRPPPLAK